MNEPAQILCGMWRILRLYIWWNYRFQDAVGSKVCQLTQLFKKLHTISNNKIWKYLAISDNFWQYLTIFDNISLYPTTVYQLILLQRNFQTGAGFSKIKPTPVWKFLWSRINWYTVVGYSEILSNIVRYCWIFFRYCRSLIDIVK